jgi:iron complex transport system substrate-binding protein
MRVAALLPAATDIVIALGAGEQLVAVTHACSLPGRLAGIPRVTGSRVDGTRADAIDARVSDLSAAGAPLFDLDEATLAAQQPDVILTQAVCAVCAVREEDARAVASRMTPPPHVATLGATTVDGILADCMTVARALDIPEEGEELVAGLRNRMATVHRTLEQARAPRPGVLVLEWTDPPFSAGHWVPDAVRRAGGTELSGETGEPSRRVAFDELRGRDPAVIILAPCGYSLADTVREAESIQDADLSSWVRTRPLWAVDATRLLSSPGPGVIRGIEVLARILHPTLFGNPEPRDAVALTTAF